MAPAPSRSTGAEAPEANAQRLVNGMQIRATGNLTKDPYITDKVAFADVAISRGHKQEDGTYKNGEPTYVTAVFKGEARDNLPEGLKKGARIELKDVSLETVKNNDPKYPNKLEVHVFKPEQVRIVPRRAAGGAAAPSGGSAPAPSNDEPPL